MAIDEMMFEGRKTLFVKEVKRHLGEVVEYPYTTELRAMLDDCDSPEKYLRFLDKLSFLCSAEYQDFQTEMEKGAEDVGILPDYKEVAERG